MTKRWPPRGGARVGQPEGGARVGQPEQRTPREPRGPPLGFLSGFPLGFLTGLAPPRVPLGVGLLGVVGNELCVPNGSLRSSYQRVGGVPQEVHFLGVCPVVLLSRPV